MPFEEDANQILKDHDQQNLSLLRKIVIKLLTMKIPKLAKKYDVQVGSCF